MVAPVLLKLSKKYQDFKSLKMIDTLGIGAVLKIVFD